MNKHLLVILAIVAVVAGVFVVKNAKAGCKGGSCGKKVVRTVRR
jgi:hypothetical protein